MTAPTRFRAACTECRQASELGADAFRLTLGGTRERSYYSFTCPCCGAAVRRRAGERIVEALAGAGVRTMRLYVGEQTSVVQ
jgi:Fe-S oxidoreductase